MKLPKLYRKVWIKWEWMTGHCFGGVHIQNSGVEYFQIYRTKSSDNKWYWKLVDESKEHNTWEEYVDDDLVCEFIVSKPPLLNGEEG